ncbi:MAG: sulfatase [Ignavibacteriae bacterium HGW-Ignavibacteriae-2]|nr:MAG: sulfatase [Ignavibacteriae bacterium HGW-Ignavibacteriae-2]
MLTSRRKFIKTVGLSAAVLGMPKIFAYNKFNEVQPNIVFIMSDDHAEQAISCYGSKLIKTPNIDRIAKEGILFQNSFVTNSICGPSRATMLTGKYSHINGFRDNKDEFDGSQVTFPKLLQNAGYQTFLIGKWHLKSTPTGFDNWKVLIDQGQYYNPVFKDNETEKEFTGYATDLIADYALDMLEQRDRNKPFCLLVHNKAPHRNWMPAARHLGAFDNKEIPIPETFFDDYSTRENTAGKADMRISDMYLSMDMKLKKGFYDHETGSGGSKEFASKVEDIWQTEYDRMNAEQKLLWDNYYDKINLEFKETKLEGMELVKWKYQRYMKDYLSCILSVDENVGKLLNYLDSNKLSENTIVVYTSDQGFYLGEHGWYDKRFMFEQSLGMPLVMRYPREIKSEQVCDKMVLNLDFAPTFLDYTNIKIPNEIQGESFRKIAGSSTKVEWRNSIYYHYYEFPHGWHSVKRHYGIRTERYKLIHYYNDVDLWELYDLKEDPNEVVNLYDNHGYEKIIEQLKIELKKLQEKYNDTEIPG